MAGYCECDNVLVSVAGCCECDNELESVAGCCECDNEFSYSIKKRRFLAG